MRHPRLPIILLVATGILLASCGGDSDNFADDNDRSPMMDDSMGHNRVGHDDSSEVALTSTAQSPATATPAWKAP